MKPKKKEHKSIIKSNILSSIQDNADNEDTCMCVYHAGKREGIQSERKRKIEMRDKILEELFLAKQCMHFKNIFCRNHQCQNYYCPLNKKHRHLLKMLERDKAKINKNST